MNGDTLWNEFAYFPENIYVLAVHYVEYLAINHTKDGSLIGYIRIILFVLITAFSLRRSIFRLTND